MSQTQNTSSVQPVQPSDKLAHDLSELEWSLDHLKNLDETLDRREALNNALGIDLSTDRDLEKKVASDAVAFYAQEVVNDILHKAG